MTWGMILARLAFIMRAYIARVGPLETMSIIPIRSFLMRSPWQHASLPLGASRTCNPSRCGYLPLWRHRARSRLPLNCHRLPVRISELDLVYSLKRPTSRGVWAETDAETRRSVCRQTKYSLPRRREKRQSGDWRSQVTPVGTDAPTWRLCACVRRRRTDGHISRSLFGASARKLISCRVRRL